MVKKSEEEILLLNELGLLLSEKRTYLSILRTGVAVFGLSITALGVLLATANSQTLFSQSTTTVIVVVLVAVALIGFALTVQAERKVSRINDMIKEVEEKSKRIAEILV